MGPISTSPPTASNVGGHWAEWLLLACVLVAGAGARLYELETVPPRISADEYTTVTEAFEVLTGHGPALFGLDWKPMPALTTHVTALTMRIFGPTIAGMRSLSVILSLIAGLLLYLVLRWHCAAPLAAATVLTFLFNPWFLNFSRSGWENGHVATYWLLFTWCFFRALREERGRWLACAGAGVALALSLYGYFSGRLLVVVWLCYAPFARALSGLAWSQLARLYVVTGAVALAFFAPEVPTVVRDWDRFQGRVRNVSIFNVDPRALGYETTGALVAGQLAKTTRYLVVGAGIGGVHYSPTDRPPYHWALVPLILLGMVRAVWTWRFGMWWLLLVFVPILATQALSAVGDPNLARMAGTVAGFFWLAGYGAQWPVDRLPRRWRGGVYAAVLAGAVALSAVEFRFFRDWMLTSAVANARGGGVEYTDFPRWRDLQFRRLATGRPTVPVIEWERPEVRAALLAEPSAAP